MAAGYFSIAVVRFLWNPRTFTFYSPGTAVVLVVGAATLTIYFTVCWTTTGRSYGDHVLALRVVNRRGQTLPLGVAFVRAAFCSVVPIGLFWAAVNRENRSIQDVVLRTSVLYDWNRARRRP